MTTPGSETRGWGSETPPSPHKTPSPNDSQTDLCVLRHRKPARVSAGTRCCVAHLKGMQDMLDEAMSLFADLDDMAVPGPSTEEHVRGKPVASKPPFRLDVLVVADTLLVEVVDDTVPVGVVARWAYRLGEERSLSRLDPRDGMAALARLRLHVRWAADSVWLEEFETDLRRFLGGLRRLAGDRPRPRVGSCQIVEEDSEVECGGPLLADRYGGMGVTCMRCGDRWDEDELRWLGQVLASGARSE